MGGWGGCGRVCNLHTTKPSAATTPRSHHHHTPESTGAIEARRPPAEAWAPTKTQTHTYTHECMHTIQPFIQCKPPPDPDISKCTRLTTSGYIGFRIRTGGTLHHPPTHPTHRPPTPTPQTYIGDDHNGRSPPRTRGELCACVLWCGCAGACELG